MKNQGVEVVDINGSCVWIHPEEYKILEEVFKRESRILLGLETTPELTEEQKHLNHLKYALVDNHKIIFVHDETYEGYECEETCPALKLPLQPYKYKKFVRWARSMDI